MKLHFKNSAGECIVLSGSSTADYAMTQCDIGAVSEETNTSKIPFCDGEIYHSCRLGSRDILVSGTLRGEREWMTRVLSPHKMCVLTVQHGGTKLHIDGKVTGGIQYTNTKPQTFAFVFRCFDPYFYTDEVTYSLSIGTPTIVRNSGHIQTPFYALLNGNTTAEVVRLENKTAGVKIEIDKKLAVTNGLEIDTGIGRKHLAYLAGTDSPFVNLTPESSLFLLDVGNNEIVSSHSGILRMRNRFLDL